GSDSRSASDTVKRILSSSISTVPSVRMRRFSCSSTAAPGQPGRQRTTGLPPSCLSMPVPTISLSTSPRSKQQAAISGQWRSTYVKFTDEIEQTMSAQRQLDRLRIPIVVSYGTNETPEFQRQSRDFAAAVKAAGKPVELLEAPNFAHMEMGESLGNPYGPNGRA